jgi:uncharacterized protein (DUF58 family)
MPTSRTITFLMAAFVLYLFANQTQVGWLYIMSALLGGTVLAALLLSRGTLRGIHAERNLGEGASEEYYEGDETFVRLKLSKAGRTGVAQVSVTERCPLVAPEHPYRNLQIFVPTLPAGGTVEFTYDIVLDRRGLHEFSPLEFVSGAPFGFFRHRQSLSIPTRVLVYPEVRPLHRLSLLDRRNAPEVARPRAGMGYEVMGVRPFRSGDTPRHIHWRSVARTGQLISKEFADEAQPGVTLVLDLYRHPYPETESKHTPFEWGVKAAASIGDYARQKNYPMYLLADEGALPVPSGAVAWSALLQWLARVQPSGWQSLGDVLQRQTQALVAVILCWPDMSAVEPLLDLRRRGADVLAAVPDPATFPDGGESASALAKALAGAGVDVRLLEYGGDWAAQLADETKARVST